MEIESEKGVMFLSNPNSHYFIDRVNPLAGANHSIHIYILCGLLVVRQEEEINFPSRLDIVELEL